MSCGNNCSHDHHGHEEHEEFENPEHEFMSEGEHDETPKELPAGVDKQVIREAPQSETDLPKKGDEVTVHYVGTLLSDGSEFDSSRDRSDPFKFTLGQGQVIKGWDLGVATMKKGELAKFTLTSDFAYGASGSPPKIPANATLVFEVELLSFGKPLLDICHDGGLIKEVVRKSRDWKKPKKNDDCTFSITYTSAKTVSLENQAYTLGAASTCIDTLSATTLDKILETMVTGEKAKISVRMGW